MKKTIYEKASAWLEDYMNKTIYEKKDYMENLGENNTSFNISTEEESCQGM